VIKRQVDARSPLTVVGIILMILVPVQAQQASVQRQALPNMGQTITPMAPEGARFVPLEPGLPFDPNFLAGQGWQASNAVTTVVSPDRNTLLILTSGYNRVFNTNFVPPVTTPATSPYYLPASNEYVFIYDISTGAPVKKQVLQMGWTYHGIAFDPHLPVFYVSGGPADAIFVVVQDPITKLWANHPEMALPLSHGGVGLGLLTPPQTGPPVPINDQVNVHPCAAGLAIARDGQTLVVTNYYNDSITVFSGGFGKWVKVKDLDLRPGKNDPSQVGVPGGEYPFWVAIKGTGADAVAYVSSIRDREVVVVKLAGSKGLFKPVALPEITSRIHVVGQPNKMTLNAAQTRLYVAEDQSDTVDVIDTATNTIVETIPVIAPASVVIPKPTEAQVPFTGEKYTGANTNSVALSPDEKQLYVTNGNLNSIAVVALGGSKSEVIGLIPTGWYPNSVSFGNNGRVYVVNGKSPTGPNAGWCYGGYGPPASRDCGQSNQYNPQLTKAGFQSFPAPDEAQLKTLTATVAANNRLSSTETEADLAIMKAVREGTKHVIFIIKENRTYDQILGDLEIGNGDPDLTEFGEATTPNQHNLARKFVTLDNFLATAEVSYDGWLWTTAARAPDVAEHQMPVAYAYRGLSLDVEMNRNVNVSIPTTAGRLAANPFTSPDPDVLPGQTNAGAPDGPNNQVNTGYIWDAAFRKNLTVRNYGFFVDTSRYFTSSYNIPPTLRHPFDSGTQVAYPTSVSLTNFTDIYFRGFDPAFADFYRYQEWEREFDLNYAKEGLPALSLVRLAHNHTGSFDTAIDGVDVPERQVADNDYAVGLLIEKISKSVYANSTLIFVIEDDAQDGGDHMDSHRSPAFVAGAYVKQNALVSTQYNTIDYLRTIEEVLGIPPMNLNDALARPMTNIFTTTPQPWSFTATVPASLYATKLPLPPKPAGVIVPKSTHNAKYWTKATKGMDFEEEDRVDPTDFNHILWKGLKGNQPYPEVKTGLDLRENREELLKRYRQSHTK